MTAGWRDISTNLLRNSSTCPTAVLSRNSQISIICPQQRPFSSAKKTDTRHNESASNDHSGARLIPKAVVNHNAAGRFAKKRRVTEEQRVSPANPSHSVSRLLQGSTSRKRFSDWSTVLARKFVDQRGIAKEQRKPLATLSLALSRFSQTTGAKKRVSKKKARFWKSYFRPLCLPYPAEPKIRSSDKLPRSSRETKGAAAIKLSLVRRIELRRPRRTVRRKRSRGSGSHNVDTGITSGADILGRGHLSSTAVPSESVFDNILSDRDKRQPDQSSQSVVVSGVKQSHDAGLVHSTSASRHEKLTNLDDPDSPSGPITIKSSAKRDVWPETGVMLSHIKVITTPTADTPGTLLELFFDDKRYLIGQIHEGAQRAFIQNGARFAKYCDVFVTGRTEWANIGGLLGCMLTLADVHAGSATSIKGELQSKIRKRRQELKIYQTESSPHAQRMADQARRQLSECLQKLESMEAEKPHIGIHGGANITYALATSKRFILRNNMHINVQEHSSLQSHAAISDRAPDWADDHVRVWVMSVVPEIKTPSHAPADRGAGISSKSPLKRSAEHAFRFEDPNNSQEMKEELQAEETRKASANIVDHVFNSSWTWRQLTKTHLSQVADRTDIFLNPGKPKLVTREELKLRTGEDDPQVWTRTPWPGASAVLPSTSPNRAATSYIFKTHPQRGKFLPAKAIALGVQPGRDFGRLTAGKSVETANGTTVHPHMVLEDGEQGRGVAIIDLPSADYISSLAKRTELTAPFCENIDAYFWILGSGVIEDDRIKLMMRKIDSAQHIISSPETSPNYLAMEKAASSVARLNRLDPNRFQVPHHENTINGNQILADIGQYTPKTCFAQRGLKFRIKPRTGLDEKDIFPLLNTSHANADTPEMALALAQDAAKHAKPVTASCVDLPSEDAEISFLGTGSASPSMHRNVAGILLRVPGCGSYLFDCGEGTLGQLKRMYSPTDLSEILRDLKMVWISHMHADHHLGITSIIKAWCEEVHGSCVPKDSTRQANQQVAESKTSWEFYENLQQLLNREFLCINGDIDMSLWLEDWSRGENFGFEETFCLTPYPISQPRGLSLFYHLSQVPGSPSNLPNRASLSPKSTNEISQTFFRKLGVADMQVCYVDHCNRAMAISLTFPGGFKFSYSGDCRPSKEFALIGKDSTVVVHEATFDDDMQNDAKKKKHSTTSEAIAVGRAMNAKRIILTHFSQRYQKLPVIRDLSSLENIPIEQHSDKQAGAEETDDGYFGSDETVGVVADNEDLNKENGHAQSNETVKIESDALAGETDSAQAVTIDSMKDSQGPVEAQANGQSNQVDNEHVPMDAMSTPSAPSDNEEQMSLLATQPESPPYEPKIGVAFDYMRVKVKDIEHLHLFRPAIEQLFAAQEGEEPLTNEEINRGKKGSKKSKAAKAVEWEPTETSDPVVEDEPVETSLPAYSSFDPQPPITEPSVMGSADQVITSRDPDFKQQDPTSEPQLPGPISDPDQLMPAYPAYEPPPAIEAISVQNPDPASLPEEASDIPITPSMNNIMPPENNNSQMPTIDAPYWKTATSPPSFPPPHHDDGGKSNTSQQQPFFWSSKEKGDVEHDDNGR